MTDAIRVENLEIWYLKGINEILFNEIKYQ